MNAVPAKEEQRGVPVRVRLGTSTQAEVIAPFQYYSEPNERIEAIDFVSHLNLARLYRHFDAGGREIARVLWQAEEAGELTRTDYGPIDAHQTIQDSFANLLFEMHLAASRLPDQLYNPAELQRLCEIGGQPPVVIGGCGRSGTTLLLSILGAHPAIRAFPDELYAFYPFPFRLRGMLDLLEADPTPHTWRRWCEKTPKNVRAFRQIRTAFNGQVRLIHVVRDGRAVTTSHHPNAVERYYVSPERWVADVAAGLALGEDVHLVRYEELVAQSESTLKALCDFIGEEFDERMLAFEQHSSVLENKAWEGRKAQSLHQERVEAWRRPEHTARVHAFMETPGAAELMAELGYD